MKIVDPTAVWDVRPWGGQALSVRDYNGDGKAEVLFLQTSGAHANEAFDPRFPELDFYKTGAEDQDLFCMTLVDAEGEILWQVGEPWALDRPFSWNGHWSEFCDVVDLDGDGRKEILLVHKDELLLFDGETGRSLKRLKLPNSGFNYARAVKTDLSGHHHIFTKSGTSSRTHSYGNPSLLLDHNLDTVWEREVDGSGHFGNFADVDGDGLHELLIGFSFFDHDGKPLWSHTPLSEDDHLDDSVIADLDGDGEFEFALAHDGHEAYIHNANGSERVCVPMHHCQSILAGSFVDTEPGLQLAFVDRQTSTGERNIVVADAYGRELSRQSTLGYSTLVNWPSGSGSQSLIRVERPTDLEGEHRVVWFDPTGEDLASLRARLSFRDHILRLGLDQVSFDRASYHGVMLSPSIGDLDGDGVEELLVTDRNTVWIFKRPEA